MTVREIVIEYLKTHGYDGLCVKACDCGIDDLFPCGDVCGGCKPAKKVICSSEIREKYHLDDLELYPDGEEIFVLAEEKRDKMTPEISDAFDDIMCDLGAARDQAEKMRHYIVHTRIDMALDKLELLRKTMKDMEIE